MTDSIIIAAFLFFVVFLIVLDIAMIVSLIVPGDERKQMVVWKASTYTLIGTVGSLAISIAEKMISQQALLINPLTQLGATALIYFVFLLYYKRRYSG